MGRFDDCYEDDENYPNAGSMWWANIGRAIRGRKGQKHLRELEAVLVALPEKRLISGRLVDREGAVCAVAAFAVAKREQRGEDRAAVLAEYDKLYGYYCECFHEESDHPDGGPCERCANGSFSTPCSGFRLSDEADEGDQGDMTAREGKSLGMTYALAWRLAYLNDGDLAEVTLEERYERVLFWIREQLRETAAA